MLTDKEEFELEIRSAFIGESIDFSEMKFLKNDNILLKGNEFADQFKHYYPKSIHVVDGNTLVSLYVFRLLQLRFFRENKTVKSYNYNWKTDRVVSLLRVEYNFLTLAIKSLESNFKNSIDFDLELISILKDKGFKVRNDNNFENDIALIKEKANQLFVEYNAKNF